MYTSRPLQLLLVAISIICIVQAAWWDAHRFDSRNSRTLTRVRRQDLNGADTTPTPGQDTAGKETGSASDKPSDPTSKAPETTPSSSSETPSSTPPSSTSESSTSETKSDLTTPSQQPTPTPTPSSPPPTESSATDPPQSTTPPAQQTSQKESTTPTAQPHVSTKVEVVTRTNQDGSKTTQSTTSVITPTPGANQDKDSSGSSGISTKTRNTIIGAVVGVGGAILIGALAIVAFRIWGRKKQAEESAALMDYNIGSSGAEKAEPPTTSGSGQQRNPFQSTLENYHQPTAPVNASSNF